MKKARLNAFGVPAEVVTCVDAEEPAAPGAGEITIEVLAAPINPAELLLIEGRYAVKPPLPAPLGIEGAGRVVAVGPGVEDLAEGDLVMSLARTNWVERITLRAADAVKAPADIDVAQLSMLKVNPATAYLMLRRYVDLRKGDWVIQNAANSGVGINLIKLARAWGFRTVNVVRRETLIAPLTDAGADVAVVDGNDVHERVAAATGGGNVRLAIDAVAGEGTLRLSRCLGDGGVLVNYGMLTGQPAQAHPNDLVFRDLKLVGFWLARLMRETPFEELRGMYRDLMELIRGGEIEVPVEKIYPLTEVAAAVEHAGREGRDGKILVAPPLGVISQ